ncbi:MAG: endonuclease VII domain-containing protein [Novosphingobium sp.]|nr:endonuclease VII domain-containing protein [Novosphingobium sp.]
MENQKICSKCKVPKDLNEFHKRKSSKDGYDHHCKECTNARHRNKYHNDSEYKERKKRYSIKRNYNLSDKQLDELYSIGHCQICKTKLIEKKKMYIDHNHTTGEVRGLLCSNCNTILGLCNDNISILQSAISYLKKNA